MTGAMIAHVPLPNLCGAFHTLMNTGLIDGEIKAWVVGTSRQTVNPPAGARYERRRGAGRDQPGGGAEWPCQYRLNVETQNPRRVMAL